MSIVEMLKNVTMLVHGRMLRIYLLVYYVVSIFLQRAMNKGGCDDECIACDEAVDKA